MSELWDRITRWFLAAMYMPETIMSLANREHAILTMEKRIMTEIQDLSDTIDALTGAVSAVSGELKTLVADVLQLRTEMAGGQLGPQLQALQAKAKAALDTLTQAEKDAEAAVAEPAPVQPAPASTDTGQAPSLDTPPTTDQAPAQEAATTAAEGEGLPSVA